MYKIIKDNEINALNVVVLLMLIIDKR